VHEQVSLSLTKKINRDFNLKKEHIYTVESHFAEKYLQKNSPWLKRGIGRKNSDMMNRAIAKKQIKSSPEKKRIREKTEIGA